MSEIKLQAEWKTPYSYKKGGMFTSRRDIIFEDTILLAVDGNDRAIAITAALNGAYNLGRSSVIMEQTFNQLVAQKKEEVNGNV